MSEPLTPEDVEKIGANLDVAGRLGPAVANMLINDWRRQREEIERLSKKPPEVETCDWDEDDDGVYETSCKHSFECNDGTPTENGFRFCVYCGKTLVEHRAIDPDSVEVK